MRYKFIQLKDLPNSPAGTVFECRGTSLQMDWTKNKRIICYEILSNETPGTYREITYATVGGSLFDDPEWFKKEVDYDKLIDLKCPKCGETRMSLQLKTWHVADMRSDDYGSHAEILIECPCGHTRTF